MRKKGKTPKLVHKSITFAYKKIIREVDEKNTPVNIEALTIHEAKRRLLKLIQDLLDNNFNLLVNLLYRIDVSEIKLKQKLVDSSPDQLADEITELIIERQKQKLITREKYKNRDHSK